MKYIKYVREHFKDPKFPVFTLYDLRTALRLEGISDAYLKRLVNSLMKKEEITRITRGVYTFHDDVTVAGFAYRPFYYGMEDALSIRGLSEQGTNPYIMTTKNVRTGVRTFKGRNYVIRRIPERMFFGYELLQYYNFWIPVSDVEKSFIDMLYFEKNIRDELLAEIIPKISMSKLRDYLKGYDKSFSKKVIRLCDSLPRLKSWASDVTL